MPQSRSTGRSPRGPSPTFSTKMFPGCGSPWTRPSSKASMAKASTSCAAMVSRSVPAGMRSVSVIFQPSMNLIVSTRGPQRRFRGSGQPTAEPARRSAASASEAFLASSRKSTSSREERRISLMISVKSGASSWYFTIIFTRYSMLLRSVPESSATPGCSTFTQTFSPVALSHATCAWPMLAEARGCSSNLLKISAGLQPRSSCSVCCTSPKGVMGMWSCSGSSVSTQGSGSTPFIVEAFWPILMKKPR
mmetsp:Transcript_45051/g.143522  ORF Transcript_45051/g.143522 Transcript_45051/m.143522 type:complete len:249 (+) Transcript_45051:446-1192(+)